MKNTLKLLFAVLFVAMVLPVKAQVNEIKQFAKDNKELIKQLKKEYKADVEVRMSNDYVFYFIIKSKEKYSANKWVANETGQLIVNEPIFNVVPVEGGRFLIGDLSSSLWGVYTVDGKEILPRQFTSISYGSKFNGGIYQWNNHDLYAPASQAFFMCVTGKDGDTKTTFYATDGATVLGEYPGELSPACDKYWMTGNSGRCNRGLITMDGKRLTADEYETFYFYASGMITPCITGQYDNKLYGAIMVNPEYTLEEPVPVLFHKVSWNDDTKRVQVKMHRDDAFVDYQPGQVYSVNFYDRGHGLYDAGNYQDVITYYEGEGYGHPWGYYLMGKSALELAYKEEFKMDYCISTLKSSDKYYLPVENPDNYAFNAGTVTEMYLRAGNYFERYINLPDSVVDAKWKDQALSLRGKAVAGSTGVARKTDEYGRALSSASARNIERKAEIARQQAARQQQVNNISRSVSKIIGSFFR